ncbi:hypothetical protein C1H46_010434 [Malus baccata]|uniref:DNA-directed RNA polymerase III subunit RPC3 n=1 Tax=Malus baccata TaxID=106549 RepID=A0A540MYN4_MALBA|nr:hypothetical protein C1H46_010434 [Malus baccata]
MSTGDKRKHDALELDEEFANNEVVIWRANFEEFIRCLRHKACVENVRARLDDGAALVLRAMLMSTRTAEKKVKTENSVPVSFSTIYEEVINTEAGRNLTCDYVKASLSLFCNEKGYLKKILELAPNDEVESIVLKRYGRDAYKMFRLLSTSSRALEMDKISDMTLVEKKEIPTILYKLWKDGAHKRTGPLGKQLQRFRNVVYVMHASQLKIDDAIMLFHDL